MVLMITRELVKYYGRIEQCKERNICGFMVMCTDAVTEQKLTKWCIRMHLSFNFEII